MEFCEEIVSKLCQRPSQFDQGAFGKLGRERMVGVLLKRSMGLERKRDPGVKKNAA
jgi:hypothetical protein